MKSFVLSAAIAAVTMLGTTTGALAEWKPNGPIKLMIAFAAGGGADTIARAIGDEVQKQYSLIRVKAVSPEKSRLFKLCAPVLRGCLSGAYHRLG